jgi:peptidoglycan/LPS O-acetylase OafA/YrhL
MVTSSFSPSQSAQISRLPYLPGLDGMRALAVAAVMIYHANHRWLSGGFLGVEVFFVISGYLITLLLIAEHERRGRIDLLQFWKRRFRRLLPALFVMMATLAVYMALFRRTPLGRTRGDFAGGIFYISNWYQIVVGQGYTAAEAFVPLRHLWSLAVEEQFYLFWPLLMVAVLARRTGRDLPRVALWFGGASIAVAVVVALLFHSGDVAATCTADQRQGYWTVFGRCISTNEALYLGTLSRAGGLLLGAAFALVWRPLALLRGPMRHKARPLDMVGVAGLLLLVWLVATRWLSESGQKFGVRFDSVLFRGGFLLTGIGTVAVIAAVTHQFGAMGKLLGNPLFNWIGTRSYGLYLYHWPIYQILRGEAGLALRPVQVVVAMAITIPLTEASYRFVEIPIRQGRLGELLRNRRRRRITPRPPVVWGGAAIVGLLIFAGVSIVLAPNKCVGQVECDLAAAKGPPDSSPAPTNTSPAAGNSVPEASPQSTASTSSTTTTTLPVDQRPPVAIGESVMLGAKKQLEAAGFVVDAAESRQAENVIDIVARLRAAGRLGNLVVIHIGTNGDVTDADFAAIMKSLPPEEVKTVWFLTVRADKVWIPTNNARLIALPATYTNVHIGYWGDIVPSIPGMASDGIHLGTAEAKKAYVAYISEWTKVKPGG